MRRGLARWEGDELVYLRAPEPLTHGGVPVAMENVQNTRVLFPERNGGSW